jgi:hypothetical protein
MKEQKIGYPNHFPPFAQSILSCCIFMVQLVGIDRKQQLTGK